MGDFPKMAVFSDLTNGAISFGPIKGRSARESESYWLMNDHAGSRRLTVVTPLEPNIRLRRSN